MKKLFIFLSIGLLAQVVKAQKEPESKDAAINAEIDYEELFSELDSFLDSLLKPRSYTVINVGAGSNFFDYTSGQEASAKSKRQLVLSPSVGYYDKSGFGITAVANIVNEKSKLTPYQYSGTLSYDYLKNMNFVSGVSATHYFTKDSLQFYTSPLKNELAGYFTYRSLWFKPSISASYGWGSKESVEEREDIITAVRKKKRIDYINNTQITTKEKVSDFNLLVSVRHDFYWLNVLSKRDYIRFTPQLIFTSGTQRFGFNQTTNTFLPQITGNEKKQYGSESFNLDESLKFQPLSVAAAFKSELSLGHFFIQPQVVFNYYIPATKDNLSTILSVNTGFIF
jgi:hypothetical protein